MLERTRYPAGIPCWVDTAQPDPQAAVAFYGGLFGWEFEDSMPADSPVRYFLARLRGRNVAAVGSVTHGHALTPVWTTYIEGADPGVRQRHKDAGAPEGFTDAIAWLRPITSDRF